MRQVCTEASNESFAGNSGFYKEKKDEEEDKKEGDQLRAYENQWLFIEKEKQVQDLQLSRKCLRGSFSVFPHREDKRL